MSLDPLLRRIACVPHRLLSASRIADNADEFPAMCQRLRAVGFGSVLLETNGTDASETEVVVRECNVIGLAVMISSRPPESPSGERWRIWLSDVERWAAQGVNALRFVETGRLPAEDWCAIREALAAHFPDLLVTAWTPGEPAQRVRALARAGFDAVYSSLAWWDQRSSWLLDEGERLQCAAPVVAPVTVPDVVGIDPRRLVDDGILLQRLCVVRYLSQGLLMDAERALSPSLGQVLHELDAPISDETWSGRFHMLSGPLAASTILYRSGASRALILHDCQPDTAQEAMEMLSTRLPEAMVVNRDSVRQMVVGSRAVSIVNVEGRAPVRARHVEADADDRGLVSPSFTDARATLQRAMSSDRVVVDEVTPHVDQGRFPVKRILGRPVEVQATVFADGHFLLGVALLWRAADELHWRQVPMEALGNDRWVAHFVPERLGRHYYMVHAWIENDGVRHRTRQCAVFPLQVERQAAEFGSWYELFPRSMGAPGTHGRFRDVLSQLSRIRDMGFDVLYFPPIHPIGHTNRKGRNNSLTAQARDPGSPYAIGSEEGGHTALHPSLGNLDEFHELRDAARAAGLELALDFAIQCSPDHPWLREHPEWFRWREDGTVQYAENPPKRYEDIVNPDFYSTTASASQRRALWRSLRDIVLYWIGQGIRIFRVDNPHTKPLPFWEWMIFEVNRRHPDVVFLSEAFTRPSMMHRLAKLGFSQSYTYFTWRNTKAELTGYLNELTSASQTDYFRPHFFVNTPDINPYFLQTSGRAGFLIRAALAATTSGLWGMYSGFELCESEALPGREEYQDSEKYEFRQRDWDRPGNIVAEITRLNALRRSNPALQTQRGLRFHAVDDERVLYFSRTTHERDNIVLVAVSLSPHETVSVRLELPHWVSSPGYRPGVRLLGLHNDEVVTVQSGLVEAVLIPDQPFVLWSVLA